MDEVPNIGCCCVPAPGLTLLSLFQDGAAFDPGAFAGRCEEAPSVLLLGFQLMSLAQRAALVP